MLHWTHSSTLKAHVLSCTGMSEEEAQLLGGPPVPLAAAAAPAAGAKPVSEM